MCQEALRLAGWPTVARPVVWYGPVRLALTPAHLPELTRLLPHHLSRRTKCAMVSWQSSPKCQPGVTNPYQPLGPCRPGCVGRCPGSDGKPGTCHGNNNHWSTTGVLPSCPGRTELVQWGRGWLFSLLALNLTKLGYSLVDRGQLDRNETSQAQNALGEHTWTLRRSNPIPLKAVMNETNCNLASLLTSQRQWSQKTNNMQNIFCAVWADGFGGAVRVWCWLTLSCSPLRAATVSGH